MNMKIIPAIDLIGGNCVRLSQGDFSRKTFYADNPLEVAKMFEDAGIERLHIVDLDGAKMGKPQHLHILSEIATHTNLVIDFGGGIRTMDAMQSTLDAGASMFSIGSMALKEKNVMQEAIKRFGAECFFLGADVRDSFITVSGWMESSQTHVIDFIQEYVNLGVLNFFCTDVAKDGMLEGPAVELYQQIIRSFPQIELVASGGVSSLTDLHVLDEIGCSGAIVGKAIYENKISIQDLKELKHAR
ncbi:MAG: 1-(5-phosphoribosyl)-5-[(5-phosphoribosylamino)methylideneamino]imidazole-4-carboxamide isomerase [Flavobacteriales bacterium]